jgi:hypothetical protein
MQDNIIYTVLTISPFSHLEVSDSYINWDISLVLYFMRVSVGVKSRFHLVLVRLSVCPSVCISTAANGRIYV